MKSLIVILIMACVTFALNTASAEPSGCYWEQTQSTEKLMMYWHAMGEEVDLSSAVVGGGVSQSVSSAPSPGGLPLSAICNFEVARINSTYTVEGAELAEGFTNVYKTGLKGVGIKIAVSTNVSQRSAFLPYTMSEPNIPGESGEHVGRAGRINAIAYSYIRTGIDVSGGDINLKLRLVSTFNEWEAAEVDFTINDHIIIGDRFYGCAGVNNTLNVPLGRVSIADIGEESVPFNIDVLCKGEVGYNVPVNVYFEGDSDGPGRLNLTSGGAKGVDILLSSDSVPLPFFLGSALQMSWLRTEPNGEIYTLPIAAQYFKKVGEEVTVGKANAILKYILEYK